MTTMRKALIVGVDYYGHTNGLSGCVNDAYSIKTALERHADGTLNFTRPNLMVATGPDTAITKKDLKDAVRDVFIDDAEIALFYFSGHGYIDDTGGFLCASDAVDGDDGLALNEVMTMANNSPARNKIIILDSCHSGAAGNNAIAQKLAEISDGLTILIASTANQYAMESDGGGIFTGLLVDALNGAAANLVGDITRAVSTPTSTNPSGHGHSVQSSRPTSRHSSPCDGPNPRSRLPNCRPSRPTSRPPTRPSRRPTRSTRQRSGFSRTMFG